MRTRAVLPQVLTNCSPLEKVPENGQRLVYHVVRDGAHGKYGRLLVFLKGLFGYDAIVLHQPGLELVVLSLVKMLLPLRTARLVGMDFQFARPRSGLKGRLRGLVWYLTWRQVDLVIGHLHHRAELRQLFGIREENFRFVPFKVNGYEALGKVEITDDGYVFTGGYSWRDYGLFCRAMELVPEVPAKLVTLKPQELVQHHTDTFGIDLPSNIELVEHDLNPQTWLDMLRKARCVVLPISSDAICSNGISVALQAMALGKPVIITPTPAVDGILEDGHHCLIVAHGDPDAMAEAIRTLQNDGKLRMQLAENGRRYALSLGGVDELMIRLSKAVTGRFNW